MMPAVGAFVLYEITSTEAEQINKRRSDGRTLTADRVAGGAQVHVGNTAREGDVYPLLVVRRNGSSISSSVNGQLFLDGNDTLWVTSRIEGDAPGTYRLP